MLDCFFHLFNVGTFTRTFRMVLSCARPSLSKGTHSLIAAGPARLDLGRWQFISKIKGWCSNSAQTMPITQRYLTDFTSRIVLY